MENSFYSQVDENINMIETIKLLSKKFEKMPVGLDGLLGITKGFLENKVDAQTYCEIFLSRLPNLFQRTQFGIDKEVFIEKYSSELALVKQINSECTLYKNAETTIDKFNSNIEHLVSDYVIQ